ncbi:MAG TPA: chemotaxis protein CheB [Planctomycetota bacterium]|nr:chemotaxis protein CheB [Planctomycetota bacterium]
MAKKASREKARPFPVAAIGASAGGTEALVEFLKHLPDRPGLAFVVVEHLDPSHESLLVSVLSKATAMPVREAKQGETIKVDHVYVIPPNRILRISRRRLRLAPRAPVAGRLRPIDHLFSSLATDEGPRAVAVLLSGTGFDGVSGMQTVKSEGGITIAQDGSSARFPEMPRNAVQAGCVDLVLHPADIARELVRIAAHPYVTQGSALGPPGEAPDEPKSFARLFTALRKLTQADFSLYKRPTLRRRIARRMALHKLDSLARYAALVEEDPKEAQALYRDMLINVTGFFRDPAVFDFLKSRIFPALAKTHGRKSPIRIWVPGCATGEEAYSIAMCAVEYMSEADRGISCQVFATDLSEAVVERARVGVYPASIAAHVSPGRLRRFFTPDDGGYRISKMIRDMCVIARQDVLKDPPFSKLDLLSCRNVLIYLEPAVHRKLFPLFHYSLNPGGYLMLGTAETVGAFSPLFSLVDRKHKIYQRRSVAVPVHLDLPAPPRGPRGDAPLKEKRTVPVRDADVHREVDRLLLARYTPAGVVVNDDLEILQFRGKTDRYLHPAPGKASLNLLKMVREGLLSEVRAAFQKARRDGSPARSGPVQLVHEGRTWSLRVEVFPVEVGEQRDRRYLVLFDEISTPAPPPKSRERAASKQAKEKDVLLEQTKLELAGTKEHLQSIIEEQETTNEELKSANEEILSSNEELQSTNEELETAKEELQSTNEELTTLNEELQGRNTELSQVNNDMLNLLASVNIPILMLGNDFRIRRYTPPAEKILNVIPSDVGRPITDIRPAFDLPNLQELLAETMESVTTVVREVRDRQGRWYSLRIRPYMTREKKIEGAVLMLVDIDAHKKALDQVDALLETMKEAVLVLDGDLRVRSVNTAFARLFKVASTDVLNRRLDELDGGAWDGPLTGKLEEVFAKGASLRDSEVTLALSRLGGERRFCLSARRTSQDGDAMILATFDPVDGNPRRS